MSPQSANHSAPPPRLLLAKPGLDGHDRGALVVARALRDAGYEVIYTGRRQAPSAIAYMAVQEDVDVIGLSILSGAHLELLREIIGALEEAGGLQIPLVIGGTVLKSEEPELVRIGVAAIFPTGTSLDACVTGIGEVIANSRIAVDG